ncbi:MAG: hypothetical protein K8T25_17395 [Planctomycetia bacterium]|nr:hypothetical protein [Planctomycetia bacterium]
MEPRRFQFSLRTLLIVMTVAAVVVAILTRAWMWPDENALVGRTDAEVIARYGQPVSQSAGHYGLVSVVWTQKFKGPIKSGVFWRLRGEIYVSFEQRNGQWIVISNSYLPSGAQF